MTARYVEPVSCVLGCFIVTSFQTFDSHWLSKNEPKQFGHLVKDCIIKIDKSQIIKALFWAFIETYFYFCFSKNSKTFWWVRIMVTYERTDSGSASLWWERRCLASWSTDSWSGVNFSSLAIVARII